MRIFGAHTSRPASDHQKAVHKLDAALSKMVNCFLLQASAVASFEVFGGSADSCGWNIGIGNEDVNRYGMHNEGSDWANDPAYYRTVIQSDGQDVTHVTDFGGTFQLDANSSTASTTALVNAGSYYSANDVAISLSTGAQALPSFVTNAIGAGNSIESVSNISSNGAVANWLNGGSRTPSGGPFTSFKNSYVGEMNITSSNNLSFYDDATTVMSVNANAGLSLNSFSTPTGIDGQAAVQPEHLGWKIDPLLEGFIGKVAITDRGTMPFVLRVTGVNKGDGDGTAITLNCANIMLADGQIRDLIGYKMHTSASESWVSILRSNLYQNPSHVTRLKLESAVQINSFFSPF
jgi:hypothetical protein